MKIDSICPVIQELERVYDYVAKENGLKAIRPIITIQTRGVHKCSGWHWANKWQLGKKEISEINICAEDLKNDPIEILIHEMVHYHNNTLDISDCNVHQYHNKFFQKRAESYGLNVEKQGRFGWGNTSLSKDLKEKLKKLNIKKELFKLSRKISTSFKSPTKMKKWVCSCTTIRCATELNAKCNNCNEDFERID